MYSFLCEHVMNLPYSWPGYDILCQKHKSPEWQSVWWLENTRFWGETSRCVLQDHPLTSDLVCGTIRFPLFVCRHNDDGFLIQSLIVFLFLDSYSFHATTIIFSIIPVNWFMNLSNLFGVIWCGVLYVRQFVWRTYRCVNLSKILHCRSSFGF